jgi:hypothetical protein
MSTPCYTFVGGRFIPDPLNSKRKLIEYSAQRITEEEYAMYHRRMEWVEWVRGCPFFNNLYRFNMIIDSIPPSFWDELYYRHTAMHYRFKVNIRNITEFFNIF